MKISLLFGKLGLNIDGVMDYLKAKNFVTEKNKREDGSYEVKFESYG